MGHRRSGWLVVGLALVTGCAHSDQEWQAQVRANEQLRSKLEAEQLRAKKVVAESGEATTKLEQLNLDLRTAGIDVANIAGAAEQQARANEYFRRRQEALDATKRRIDLLRAKLMGITPALSVTIRNNRVTVQIDGDALFESGRESLKREGRASLLKLAEIIRGDTALSSRSFQVAGHVDASPAGGRFKGPMGLSLARAEEVIALLVQTQDRGGGGLNPSRWSAAGYGDADPLNTKGTPEAKQANRRCEIVLQPAIDEVLDLRSLAP